MSEMSKAKTGKVACDRESCVNNRDSYCALKNPVREGDHCLHYDNVIDALRLKVNVFKGNLRR